MAENQDSIDEKIHKYDELSKKLWDMARYGNTLQSTVAASLIRELEIRGPADEDPEDA